ncbi:MAG: hypothetical protein ABEJ83_02670 [Candidatus Nanohaloarchaea archaeon]
MRRTAIALAAALLIVGGASAVSQDYDLKTYSSFDTYEELQTLHDSAVSVNTTVVNDSGGFISLSSGPGAHLALNRSLYVGIEEIDAVRYRLEAPAPTMSDTTAMVAKRVNDSATGETKANLSLTLRDGVNTILESQMKDRNGYNASPEAFTVVGAEFQIDQGITAAEMPKIQEVEFLKKIPGKLYKKENLTVENNRVLEPFTAASLYQMKVDVGSVNHTLKATVNVYNSTEKTANKTFEITATGTHRHDLQGLMTENASTVGLELKSVNGTSNITSISVRGLPEDADPSGAAPGGPGGLFVGITGAFSAGASAVGNAFMTIPNFVGSMFYNFGQFLGGLVPW